MECKIAGNVVDVGACTLTQNPGIQKTGMGLAFLEVRGAEDGRLSRQAWKEPEVSQETAAYCPANGRDLPGQQSDRMELKARAVGQGRAVVKAAGYRNNLVHGKDILGYPVAGSLHPMQFPALAKRRQGGYERNRRSPPEPPLTRKTIREVRGTNLASIVSSFLGGMESKSGNQFARWYRPPIRLVIPPAK